jgi:uracil-DNA glycosylase
LPAVPSARIAALPRLRAIVTLGDVSRRNVLRALGARPSLAEPGHGVVTEVGPYRLFNSYHCSRLNTNTGRLTPEMFRGVFDAVRAFLD